MLDTYMEKKVQTSIERLKLASEMSETYYHQPLVITYSGGKDSDVVLALAEEAGIDFEVVMSITSVEAPQTMIHAHETARRIRGGGRKFTFRYSRDENGKPLNMHDLILKNKMMPTRIARFCCSSLKENTTLNRLVALGVRAEESSRRAKNYDVFSIKVDNFKDLQIKPLFSFEHAKSVFEDALAVSEELGEKPEVENAYDCKLISASKRNGNVTVQPIIDWTTTDIWEYIRGRGLKYNPIYDMGYHRVGCILCPFARSRVREKMIKDFPGLERYWRKICNDLYYNRMIETGEEWEKFESPDDMFDWWMERRYEQVKGQMSIFDFIEQEEDR